MVDAKRMKILAELIKEAGIKKRYFLYGRSDTIVKTRTLLKYGKISGLKGFLWGLNFQDEDLNI